MAIGLSEKHLECMRLMQAVDDFAKAMKRKLKQGLEEGKVGWDQPLCIDGLKEDLLYQAGKVFGGKYRKAVNAANYAMMIWYQKRFRGGRR